MVFMSCFTCFNAGSPGTGVNCVASGRLLYVLGLWILRQSVRVAESHLGLLKAFRTAQQASGEQDMVEGIEPREVSWDRVEPG